MTNKEVANQFKLLSDLMELSGENPFKIRSYQSAYRVIRAQPQPVIELKEDELSAIKGIGKSVISKIEELRLQGYINNVLKYQDKVPEGIVELLSVKGIGVKKIKQVWEELDVASPGELLYACKENRLVDLSGFGAKTQEKLIDQLQYYMAHADKILFAKADQIVKRLLPLFQAHSGCQEIMCVGEMARQNQIISSIELGIVLQQECSLAEILKNLKLDSQNHEEIVFEDYTITLKVFDSLSALDKSIVPPPDDDIWAEHDIDTILAIPAPMRELQTLHYLNNNPDAIEKTIQNTDIKGAVHNHTTYSDGSHSLEDMVGQAQANGYEYLVISDHSQAAFYANGLKPDRLLEQGEAIDAINATNDTFKIFKSVESDILNDGSLDYSNEILDTLDLVIASIHSNLNMDESKATARLIKAVENPYTTILGHPTGRLLLSRKGYPIDYRKVIDACIANDVIIELNANPQRLDIDWKWLHYIREKGGFISINPDAHHKAHYTYMEYGVKVAQKAAFPSSLVLNTLPLTLFEEKIRRS